MTGFIVISMLAAVTEQAAAPKVPPPLIPPPARSVIFVADPNALPVTRLDVRVAAGAEVLWSGRVRVGNGGASYSQSLRQPEESCPGQPRADASYRSAATDLRVNLVRRSGRESPDAFNVSVNWTRPVPPCEGGGNHGVSFERPADIAPGQTVRLEGDAGLAVTVTRPAR